LSFSATAEDAALVAEQLGYPVTNLLRVACWTCVTSAM